MERLYKLGLSKRQKVKVRIIKRERYSSTISLRMTLIIAALALVTSLSKTQWYAYYLLGICFAVMLSVYDRAVRHQKKKWMNHYGEQITAVVTGKKYYCHQSFLYLEWYHPQTRKIYHYKIVVPLLSKLKLAYGYQTGDRFPLWIDPIDPDFFYPDW